MASLGRELLFLILQFLSDEKYENTLHKLEQESGLYFNAKYFEGLVLSGEWDEVERYLSGFTKVEDNRYSMKMFFEIRKQKYLEALDGSDRAKAVDILVKDLKAFAKFNEDLFKEITQLLTLDNFRQNVQLSTYGDTKSARFNLLADLKKLAQANPLLQEKLNFPPLKTARLQALINQSLNWQHQLCKNPQPNPDIRTLLTDHSCAIPSSAERHPYPASGLITVGPIPKVGGFSPFSGLNPFQTVAHPNPAPIGWMAGPNTFPNYTVAQGPPGLVQPPNSVIFAKHPGTPGIATGMDYKTVDGEPSMKRMRAVKDDSQITFPGIAPLNVYTHDDLPKTVVRTLSQGSNVSSLDFHPSQKTTLLVGTNVGDIAVWDVGCFKKTVEMPFKLFGMNSCSPSLKAALSKEPAISVNRCLWNPDGSLLGVAFSKHLVQIYAYTPDRVLRHMLEIDAHFGSVNDIAYSCTETDTLSIVTCGDDKLIKVWDASTGAMQYLYKGHDAPVYSVITHEQCPVCFHGTHQPFSICSSCGHQNGSIKYIFSTAADGAIKVWVFGSIEPRVQYDAPGRCCTRFAYSSDGERLFSCGTSEHGMPFLVEWNAVQGSVRRVYEGFRKCSLGTVQFDSSRNKYLAAGDEFIIKFWDMDDTNILATTDADGGLPANPKLRFNKDGSLLAVNTNDNGIKILANIDGQRLLGMRDSMPIEVSSGGLPPQIAGKGSAEASRIGNDDPRVAEDSDKIKSCKLADINEPTNLRSLCLPESAATSTKVVGLLYTNSGSALLALGSNAVHKVWKWQQTETNSTGKSSASVTPELWKPPTKISMINDTGSNPEEATACFALSKNDSYVMSASGGKVTLFNMLTFKVLSTVMTPPPAATFLAFHPKDNNFIAIGMDDATIHIYDVRVDMMSQKIKLFGHQKAITGLTFSESLNVLVSSGADAQLCVWSSEGWEKKKSCHIKRPTRQSTPLVGDTRVQFHSDQTHLLVVHASQLGIYDSRLECLSSWSPRDALSAPISCAVYSCDCLSVYAGFSDGAVGVFEANGLELRCRIGPAAYMPPPLSGAGSLRLLAVAAHPSEPNQIAVGMSNGAVIVVEPLKPGQRWSTSLSQSTESETVGKL